MDSKIAGMPRKHNISARHKELADRFRGGMSYKEHYAYLLDWYANDRKDWCIEDGNGGNGIAAADNHVKETLKDVLDSLVHLDRKIDRVAVPGKIREKGIKASKPVRGGVAGRLFTKLIDRGENLSA